MGAPQAILATDAAALDMRVALPDQQPSQPSYRLVTDDAVGRDDTGPQIELSEDAIRQRSQQIWEREGCPDGYAEDHWRRARAELAALMARTSHAPPMPRPADDAAPPLAPCTLVVEVRAPVPDAPPQVVDDSGPSEPQPLLLQDAVISPPAAEAVSIRPQPRRLPTAGQLPPNAIVPSIISAGFVVHGVLESAGDIQFDGTMDGDVYCVSLAVGEAAVIRGEIVADKVMVRGRVEGNIRARRVYLFASARIAGDIQYGVLAIEDGAQLDGSFQRIDDSLEEVCGQE